MVCSQAVTDVVNIFTEEKSLILEAIWALDSPDRRAPMSVMCKSVSTILKSAL